MPLNWMHNFDPLPLHRNLRSCPTSILRVRPRFWAIGGLPMVFNLPLSLCPLAILTCPLLPGLLGVLFLASHPIVALGVVKDLANQILANLTKPGSLSQM